MGYMHRSVSGTVTTFTISMWTKLCGLNYIDSLWGSGSGYGLFINSTRPIKMQGGSPVTSTRLFRDTNGWYHVVYKSSGGSATTYINGESVITHSGVSISSDIAIGALNSSGGDSTKSSIFFADVIFVDGTAHNPTSFAETDSTTGEWKPKSYSGSYGTNGFKLEFKNSGALGTDTSGNSNNLTVAGSNTQQVSSPTNTFATIDRLNGNPTLNNSAAGGVVDGLRYGNLEVNANAGSVGNDDYMWSPSNMMVTKGKWYAEFRLTGSFSTTGDAAHLVGVGSGDYRYKAANMSTAIGGFTTYWVDHPDDRIVVDGSVSNTAVTGGSKFVQNDILGVYLNCDTTIPQVTFTKNGAALPGAGNSPYNVRRTGAYGDRDNAPIAFFTVIKYGTSSGTGWGKVQANFGEPLYTVSSSNADANGHGSFEYSPQLGGVNYYALCTKNLNEFGG